MSHALDQVVSLCTRPVVLDHGEVQYDGEPARAVALMRRLIGTAAEEPEVAAAVVEPVPEAIGIAALTVTAEPGGEPRYAYAPGEPLTFRVKLDVHPEAALGAGGEVAAVVMGPGQVPMWVMLGEGSGTVLAVAGRWFVNFRVEAVPPVMSPFDLAVSISDPASGRVVAARSFESAFAVPGERALGLLDSHYEVVLAREEATREPEGPGSALAPLTSAHR